MNKYIKEDEETWGREQPEESHGRQEMKGSQASVRTEPRGKQAKTETEDSSPSPTHQLFLLKKNFLSSEE